jgi:hypothetical protein
LQKTLAQLQAKSAELQAEIESEIAAAEGGLFETDDSEYNEHVVSYFTKNVVIADESSTAL